MPHETDGSLPSRRLETYRESMSARPAAVEIAHPPQAVLRVVNPLLRAALRAPLLGSALKDFMVVTFTGRKTGRRFSVVVSAHHINGDLYVLLNAGWKHNFRRRRTSRGAIRRQDDGHDRATHHRLRRRC